MLKTNCKEVKKSIRSYIMESFDPEAYGYEQYYGVNKDSEKEVSTAILDCLYNEKIKFDKRRNMSHFDYFKDWMQGLPNMMDASYYYNVSAVDLLGTWTQESDAEKERFSENDAEEKITSLLYRELVNMSNKKEK